MHFDRLFLRFSSDGKHPRRAHLQGQCTEQGPAGDQFGNGSEPLFFNEVLQRTSPAPFTIIFKNSRKWN